jgi:hypothetical protein
LGVGVPSAIWLYDKWSTRANQLSECNENHDAPGVDIESPEPQEPQTSIYQRCVWPPTSDTADDGYFEIIRVEHTLPNAAYAEQFTHVSEFQAPCDEYKLQYRFDNQGTEAVEDPIVVAGDQMVSMYDGTPVNPYEVEDSPVESSSGNLVVFEHGRYELWRIECTTVTGSR